MEYTFQEMPDMTGTGVRKVYPKATFCSQISHDYFMEQLTSHCGLSRGVIESAIGAMVGEMNHYLQSGHSVKIEGLGTFCLALGMEGRTEAETVKAKGERYDTNSVCIKMVNFQPDTQWMKHLRRNTELTKVEGIKTLRRPSTTPAERLRMALDFLAENPFMKVRDYMEMTGLQHNAACEELRRFRRDPESGIRGVGRGNMLVYVKGE